MLDLQTERRVRRVGKVKKRTKRKKNTNIIFLVYKKAEGTEHAALLSAPFLILGNIAPPLLLFPINPRLSKITFIVLTPRGPRGQ